MYRVGDFEFTINSCSIQIPENLEKFAVDECTSPYVYDIFSVPCVKADENHFDVNRGEVKVVIHSGLEKRYVYLIGDTEPYAVCQELDSNHSVIRVSEKYFYATDEIGMFMSLLSLEKRLYECNNFILHSSYIIDNGKAIIFTGPSGIGKSTQASLWSEYRNAVTINGDRSILSVKDGTLTAHGCPYCGSSGICINRDVPVKAVVLLSQAEDNHISEMSLAECMHSLFSELTINYHNESFFNNALDFITGIFTSVRVFHLYCTADVRSVECLENALDK